MLRNLYFSKECSICYFKSASVEVVVIWNLECSVLIAANVTHLHEGREVHG